MPADEFQRLCLDTLAIGAVQTFVDLCYLAVDDHATAGMPLDAAVRLLADAEMARRRGDTAAALKSYAGLADVYLADGNVRTCVYWMERSLDIARMSGDAAAELSTLRALGGASERLKDHDKAVAHHEAARALAQRVGDTAEAAAAAGRLVAIRSQQAAECEARGDTAASLAYRLTAVEAAASCDDPTVQASTAYAAGRALLMQGKPTDAIPHLQHYVSRGNGCCRRGAAH